MNVMKTTSVLPNSAYKTLNGSKYFNVNKTCRSMKQQILFDKAGVIAGTIGLVTGIVTKNPELIAVAGAIGATGCFLLTRITTICKKLNPAYQEIYERAKSVYKK